VTNERARVRRALRLPSAETTLLVLVVGQISGTDEVLEMVLGALRLSASPQSARIVVRMHPRATSDDVSRTAGVQARAPPELFDVDPAALDAFASSEDILAGADLVVSGYSTTNFFAILEGLSGVVYASTKTLRAKYRRDKKLDVPPEVEAGAAWEAGTAEELATVIGLLRRGPEGSPEMRELVKAQQALTSKYDGKAAERAWRAVADTGVMHRQALSLGARRFGRATPVRPRN